MGAGIKFQTTNSITKKEEQTMPEMNTKAMYKLSYGLFCLHCNKDDFEKIIR